MSEKLTPKQELQKEAKELGIEFVESDTMKELKAMIKEAEKGEDKKAEDKKANKKDKVFYYWVKVKSYISPENIIERGLYKFSEKVERLEKSTKTYVEKFEGDIPQSRLMEIAKELRVKTVDEKGDYRKKQEVLDEIVKDRI